MRDDDAVGGTRRQPIPALRRRCKKASICQHPPRTLLVCCLHTHAACPNTRRNPTLRTRRTEPSVSRPRCDSTCWPSDPSAPQLHPPNHHQHPARCLLSHHCGDGEGAFRPAKLARACLRRRNRRRIRARGCVAAWGGGRWRTSRARRRRPASMGSSVGSPVNTTTTTRTHAYAGASGETEMDVEVQSWAKLTVAQRRWRQYRERHRIERIAECWVQVIK